MTTVQRVAVLLSLCLLPCGVLAQGITYPTSDYVYPSDSGFYNVRNYGAVGDGVHDDTAAIRAAMNAAFADPIGSGSNATCYFPSGTYLVSDQLTWKDTGGTWRAYLRFEGQNKATTFIRLKDNATGYGSSSCTIAPSPTCKAVLYTASQSATNSIGMGEAAYKNDIWNLTVNTGSGNPGAVGIDYQCSNRCAIQNVNVVSADGNGRAGISVGRSFGGSGDGPGLVKNVSVQGFDYGIYANADANQVGMTFEYIDLQHQHVFGVLNGGMPNWFHKVSSTNSVPAFVNCSTASGVGCIHSYGSLTVVDGTFTGGSPSSSSVLIQNNQSNAGVTFLRNIGTSGYQSALATGASNTPVTGAFLSEYSWPAIASLFTSSPTSLNLPSIPNTPEFVDNNFANWADVTAFGANRNGNVDATAAINNAIASGKPILYFPFGHYWINGSAHLGNTVRKVIGLNSQILRFASNANPIFSCENTTGNSVEIRTFDWGPNTNPGFSNGCIGDFVLAHHGQNAASYSNTVTGNRVFFEDMAIPTGSHFNGETVYARQYDVEFGYPVLTNTTAWILGYKTEAPTSGTPTLFTASGGTVEILGAANYLNSGTTANPEYLFTDTQFSLSDVVSAAGWPNAIRETRSGVTRTYLASSGGYGAGAWGVGLFSGRVGGALPAPTILTFTDSPSTPVTPGTPVTLTWTSSDGVTATLNGSPVALNGSQVVSPLTTTPYTLAVSNATGPTSQIITVSVGALPVISSFTATPSTIALGSSSTLALASSGGTTCSIDQGVGTVACNSSTSVSPVTSKLYTATVTNASGSRTAQTIVGVSITGLLGATVVGGQVVIH